MTQVKLGENTKTEEIIDGQGNVVEEREYATWADLCEPPPIRERQLRNGKWIKYRPWIPADEFAEIQRKARAQGRGQRRMDEARFMTLILEQVLLEPQIRNQKDFRAAQKADANVVLGVVNEVIDTSMFQLVDETEADLGE
jgi:hypothetical protein